MKWKEDWKKEFSKYQSLDGEKFVEDCRELDFIEDLLKNSQQQLLESLEVEVEKYERLCRSVVGANDCCYHALNEVKALIQSKKNNL